MSPLLSICALSGEKFSISEREVEYCQKYNIPLPIWSPRERLKQLAVFRNRSTLYHSICALTKKKILSQMPPTTPQPVYDVSAWMSDEWDPKSYARPYDFRYAFFPQMLALARQVPLPNLAVVPQGMENSDYTNGITSAKNCYLLFGASFNEDCYFSRMLCNSKCVLDTILANDCELCYECFNVHNCYNVQFSENCHLCSDSAFLYGCQGCKNCFGCTNLKNAEYCLFNKRLSRAEYEKQRREIDLGSRATVEREKVRFAALLTDVPRKYYTGRNNEGSSGNFLNNTKNTHNSFFCSRTEDVENSLWLTNAKDCFSTCCFGNNSELIYNSVTVGDESYNVRFCVDCWPSARDLEYCMYVGQGSSHCFGCVGLKHAQYCIFNKQYTQTEYFDLLPRIITHMKSTGEYGKFFPAPFYPFAYNISEAGDFFPSSKESVLREGYTWEEEAPCEFSPSTDIPDNIIDVQDSILAKTLICAKSGKPYRITKQELSFYRQNSLPIPRIAPMVRLRQGSNLLELLPLSEVLCAKCSAGISSMYHKSHRPLYCEECFQRELVDGAQ
jgi:hypothetical protein